jgi:DNA-binding GntR family transcriptional regulator
VADVDESKGNRVVNPDRYSPEELAPVDRSSLTQQVTDLIRQAIVNGLLPPAEAVSLREVANRLGVSPTPVREALAHLGAVGLVQFLPGRVKIVAATPESFEDSFLLREALEGMTARLAATRRSDEQYARIRQFADLSIEAVKNNDPRGFRSADVSFHRSIAEAAHSPHLGRYTDNALDLALTLRNLRIAGRVFDASFAVMHEQIADAIEQHDEDAAEKLAREHIRNVGQRLLATWGADIESPAITG